MGRIADLNPGEAKTDTRDVLIVATRACALLYTLRAVDN